MSASVDGLAIPQLSHAEVNLTTPSDRLADVNAKQARLAALLQEIKCEGLLVLEPENVAWLTAGATARGIVNPAEYPALYFTSEGRWALSSNVDSQRLFDEELDGLGFQLKEWPWHWGRPQLLADLCQGRSVACDQPHASCTVVGNRLALMRRTLTAYEQACYRALGLIVSHALEACCRTLQPGDTEREIAGQLSHRLLHRGVTPVVLHVAAEDRGRLYRQCGFTSATIDTFCTLAVTARKYGLYATASRSVSLGTPSSEVRRGHDTACKVSATYLASSWPDAMPKEILAMGRRIYQISDAEHEWLLAPQGHLTGRAPVELAVTPQTEELFQTGWAVTWRASSGVGLSCDTFLVTEEGPRTVTAAEAWPLKLIRVQGAELVRPDLLIR
jgi:Xaa-Pro aminopeptidase